MNKQLVLATVLGILFCLPAGNTVADEAREPMNKIEHTAEQFLSKLYLAATVQGPFMGELTRCVRRAHDLTCLAKIDGDQAKLDEALELLKETRKLCAFVVTLDAAGLATLERQPDVPLAFYEQSSTTCLVYIDNPSGATAEVGLAADGDEFKLELPYHVSLGPDELCEIAVAVIRAPLAGRRKLKINLAGPKQNPQADIELSVDVIALHEVTLNVTDETGQPTTAAFEFRDSFGNLFPAGPDRKGIDFAFEAQVYRTSGQTINLPAGEVRMRVSRGPQYLVQDRTITVDPDGENTVDIRLERWTNLAEQGLYSGDIHLHAHGGRLRLAGGNGVSPEELYPHLEGEELNFANVLNLAVGGYEHQRQFFDAKPDPLSGGKHWMKYDLETSGREFPMPHMGHLLLTNLSSDDLPRESTWNLPVLEWAKAQPNALTGYAHPTVESYGFDQPYEFGNLDARELPVDLILGKVDMYELFNQNRVSELFLLYRLLNCGLRLTLVGGSDYPYIYDARVGVSRVYALVDGELNWDNWIEAIKRGRTFACDSESFVWLTADGHVAGDEYSADESGLVKLTARAALRPGGLIQAGRLEIVVNGEVVAEKLLTEPGQWRQLEISLPIARSSWVAARLMYDKGGEQAYPQLKVWGKHFYCSSHTGPIYVKVAGKPIRVSKKDVDWVIGWIQAVWQANRAKISDSQRPKAKAAFDEAIKRYELIRRQCP